MSFETLKVSELKQLADDFGVEIDGLKNKTDIIAALSEEGVTWAVYQKTQKDMEETEDMSVQAPAKKPELTGDAVLVKMDRKNYSYQTMGFTFTQEHPYVAMDEATAQEIFDKEEGFRLATPKEVQEFYH
jgi:hypothetical protein